MTGRARIERFFQQDLWAADTDSLRGIEGMAIKFLRLLVVAVWEFRASVLSARATGLVYTTLLSLVPFLAVMFSVLKAFGVHQQIEPLLAQAFEPLGPRGAEITAQVISFVNNLKVGVLGAVGVLALFLTTFFLIDKIEEALNAIWRVRKGRPLARKFSDYLSVVLVGPVFVFTAFAITASAQSHWLVQRVLEIQPLGYLVVFGAEFMPFVILCGVFTFIYKFVPNAQVRLMSALVGGVTAGILWQLAGAAFAAFVAGSTRYSAIYSSFAILILFLIWLYVGWLIVLTGAQVAYFHQHPSAYLTRARWRQDTHAFRENLALSALVQMTRRYLDAQPPYRLSELATDLTVPLSILESLIQEFVHHGIVHRVTEPEGVALGRPPEKVSLAEILELVQDPQRIQARRYGEEVDLIQNLLRRRDQAVQHALAGITLRSLAEQAEPLGSVAASPAQLLEERVT